MRALATYKSISTHERCDRQIMAEQFELCAAGVFSWSRANHSHYGPTFHAIVRTILLCWNRSESYLYLLPDALLDQLIGALAERRYWQVDLSQCHAAAA